MSAFFKLALQRALWTAVAVFLPMAVNVISVEATVHTVLMALSAVALAFVFSLLTSLAGLPEDLGKEYPRWVAVGIRALKTFVQAFLALLVSDLAWSDFNLNFILQALAATIVTLLRGYLMHLPEEIKPVASE